MEISEQLQKLVKIHADSKCCELRSNLAGMWKSIETNKKENKLEKWRKRYKKVFRIEIATCLMTRIRWSKKILIWQNCLRRIYLSITMRRKLSNLLRRKFEPRKRDKSRWFKLIFFFLFGETFVFISYKERIMKAFILCNKTPYIRNYVSGTYECISTELRFLSTPSITKIDDLFNTFSYLCNSKS